MIGSTNFDEYYSQFNFNGIPKEKLIAARQKIIETTRKAKMCKPNFIRKKLKAILKPLINIVRNLRVSEHDNKKLDNLLRILKEIYCIPISLGEKLRNNFYSLLDKIYLIPLSKGQSFDDLAYRLTIRTIEKADQEIKEIVSSITDEMIIYQKGELPECVIKNMDGKLIPLKGDILQIKHYYARSIVFIKNILRDDQIKNSTFLDVGATSSLFFDLLGNNGVGLNVSEGAINNMKKNGIETILASSDDIPYGDKFFDYVICFNTLGHLENPIKSMREMQRVCRKIIFLSMGDSEVFNFLDYSNDKLGIHRWHKFRWTRDALLRLIDFLNMKLIQEDRIYSFPEPQYYKEKLFQRKWGKGRKYRIYALQV